MAVIESAPNRPHLLQGISHLCDLARAGEAARGARVCLIARNPRSPAAQAVWSRLSDLREAGVDVYALFASLDKHQGGITAIGHYSAIFSEEAAEARIRQLHGRLTRKLHEQVIVSEAGLWLGDIVGSGAGAEIVAGRYIDFADGLYGTDHAAAARSGFVAAFRTGLPLSKLGQWYAPQHWGRLLPPLRDDGGTRAA